MESLLYLIMAGKRIYEYKILVFLVQIALLIVLHYLLGFKYSITFDSGITQQRKEIIQFIGNLFLFVNDLSQIYIVLIVWSILSLISVFAFRDYKKAYSLNISTFFVLNFFFYIFLSRYSEKFYESHVFEILFQSILVGAYIIIFSLITVYLFKKAHNSITIREPVNLETLAEKNRGKCPHCGTKFESIPKYCYNCLKLVNIPEAEG